ncbi:MAG: HPr(Ser) kinase/phosphatase, partial [Treponema porcinum]|nr:HPr(Ser) kinase/phosphatase [Treponema porcinum]
MSDKKFTVLDLLELDLPGHDALELRCIGGRRGLPREISIPDINRPGLALSGFFDAFAFKRVQLFGRGEAAYLQKLHDENKNDNLKALFSYKIPCCVFSNNREPTQEFFQLAEEACCPLLQTSLDTTDFSTRLIRVFSNIFAPKKTVHGVLVEVYGVGILLTGHSGVGKSETALELVERGHRLVADDIVEVRCVNGNVVLGRGANALISHHMEIRGLGIINVSQLYGVGAIRDQKEIQLVVQLEEWDSGKVYDRLGVDQKYMDILGVKVPAI